MNRTALRLGTIAALANGGAVPFPTMAGNIVFDSRSEPVELVVAAETYPMIIVHTERDREDRDAGNGRAAMQPLRRTVDMRIEFGITNSPKDASGATKPDWPEADAALEAMIDLFNLQIQNALFGKGPWAVWWRGLFAVPEIVSERFVTAPGQGQLRVAAREIMMRVTLPADCLPGFVLAPEIPPAAALPGLMKTVTDKIAADGSGVVAAHAASVVEFVAANGLPRATQWPRFEGGTMVTSRVNLPGGGTIDAEYDLNT